MPTREPYYATLDRNGTEDEITIYTPDGRAMLCVGFWDAEWGNEEGMAIVEHDAAQIKADAELIVKALNAYRPRKPKKQLTDYERAIAKAKASVTANLRKPMPKLTAYRG